MALTLSINYVLGSHVPLFSPLVDPFMARPKQTAGVNMTAGQAQYLVRRLIADRKVTEAQVNRYLSELTTEIASLEQRLEMLREASTERRAGGASSGAAGGRRRRNLSPERRESLRLQGHYLALIRQVPARKRAHFKAIVDKRGKEAAIAALRRAVGN
jgi:hypothetical protein